MLKNKVESKVQYLLNVIFLIILKYSSRFNRIIDVTLCLFLNMYIISIIIETALHITVDSTTRNS